MPHEMKPDENIEWIINKQLNLIEENIKDFNHYKGKISKDKDYGSFIKASYIQGKLWILGYNLSIIKNNFYRIINNDLILKMDAIGYKITNITTDRNLEDTYNDIKHCKLS
jgi:hypothetical protein